MLEEKLPDFQLNAVIDGEIKNVKFSEYEGKYIVIVFYPYDFTFVCPTEVNEISEQAEKFKELNAQVLFCSCDSVYSHITWSLIEKADKGIRGVKWPMISDYNKELVKHLGLVEKDGSAMRATVIADKGGVIKHISMNNSMVGRSTSEILRLLKALQYVEKNGQVCYVNWNGN